MVRIVSKSDLLISTDSGAILSYSRSDVFLERSWRLIWKRQLRLRSMGLRMLGGKRFMVDEKRWRSPGEIMLND